jgi:hypothetical protein
VRLRLRWLPPIGCLIALVALVILAITWPAPSPSQSSPTIGTVGTPIHLGAETVTLESVIDPAQPANEFAYPGADSRFVGVEFEIRNTGSEVIAGNTAKDSFAQASNGQTYGAVATPIVECSDFLWGQYDLPPGDSQTTCVTCGLPYGARLASIELTMAGRTTAWRVG